MKRNVDTLSLRPWLRAIEPALPMLATRAAVELDAQRRGVTNNMEAVLELGALLKNSLDQNADAEPSQQPTSLLDPSTMVLVGRAFEKIPNKQVTNVAELQQNLREISEWFNQSASNADASHAEVLRDFCLALASGASAHHREFRDEQPTNRYRR
ncbi:MAG: hypothetical protein HY360_24155 [Verrucomicrobia bacterium]|nr:hypothetical protein [Verrucomicrobiota bacterium]